MIKKKINVETDTVITKEYAHVLSNLKKQIKEAQVKAALSVNILIKLQNKTYMGHIYQ